MADQESSKAGGCEQPYEFEMPTAREIELDLALGSAGWQGLLAGREATAPQASDAPHALLATPQRQLSGERRR